MRKLINMFNFLFKTIMPQTRLQRWRQRINSSTRRFETFLTFNIIQSFLEKQREGRSLHALQPVTELLSTLVKQYKTWAETKIVGHFTCPSSIAIYGNSIFICETTLHCILVYDKETTTRTILHTWGDHIHSAGNGIGQFQDPSAIAISTQGIIAVCDTGNNRVQLFETDGTFRIQITTLQQPYGVAFTHYGEYLAISDTGNHCIKICKLTGEIINTIGQFGNGKRQFNTPSSIAITKTNVMFVCDVYNHRIQVIGPRGEFLTSFGENELLKPVAISVLQTGEIFISDHETKSIQGFRICNIINNENKVEGRVSYKFFEKQAIIPVYGLITEENGDMIMSHPSGQCISLFINFNFHNEGKRNDIISRKNPTTNIDEEVSIHTIKYG